MCSVFINGLLFSCFIVLHGKAVLSYGHTVPHGWTFRLFFEQHCSELPHALSLCAHCTYGLTAEFPYMELLGARLLTLSQLFLPDPWATSFPAWASSPGSSGHLGSSTGSRPSVHSWFSLPGSLPLSGTGSCPSC